MDLSDCQEQISAEQQNIQKLEASVVTLTSELASEKQKLEKQHEVIIQQELAFHQRGEEFEQCKAELVKQSTAATKATALVTELRQQLPQVPQAGEVPDSSAGLAELQAALANAQQYKKTADRLGRQLVDQQRCSQLNDTRHSQAVTQQTVALAEAKTLAQSQTTLKDQEQAELQLLRTSQGQSRQSTKADQQTAELVAEEEGKTMRKSLSELRKAVALLLHKPAVIDTKIARDVIQQITKQVQRSSMEIARPGDAIIDHSNQQADALRTIQKIEFEQGVEAFSVNIRDNLE